MVYHVWMHPIYFLWELDETLMTLAAVIGRTYWPCQRSNSPWISTGSASLWLSHFPTLKLYVLFSIQIPARSGVCALNTQDILTPGVSCRRWFRLDSLSLVCSPFWMVLNVVNNYLQHETSVNGAWTGPRYPHLHVYIVNITIFTREQFLT